MTSTNVVPRDATADVGQTPQAISATVVASFADAENERLGHVMQRLVHHLHEFVIETALTEEEWRAGIEFLTATGHMCGPTRQEFILLSDTLGVSMVLDAVNHPGGGGTTESTVLGPFYVPDAPERAMGESIAVQEGSGFPTHVTGTVRDEHGTPIAGALLDVWQNSAKGTYAAQDPTQPPENLRGRFRTGPDGAFSFWSVRPTDYTVPHDGTVGALLAAVNRHPWRAAHIHVIASAPGFVPVTTHFFDDESTYLDSDTVFGVKPSLICHFEPHDETSPDGPSGYDGRWYTLEHDIALAHASS